MSVASDDVSVLFAIAVVFPFPLSREMGFDPGVFGRFNLAALVRPHLNFLFVCLYTASGCLGDGNQESSWFKPVEGSHLARLGLHLNPETTFTQHLDPVVGIVGCGWWQ